MPALEERSRSEIEAAAAAAHRDYIEAFVVWERLYHQTALGDCQPDGLSVEQGHMRALAEARKEKCRLIFRDLCVRLGYVPEGLSAALPNVGED